MTAHPKVRNAGLGGAVAIVALWVLNAYAGFDPPPEIAAAITTIVTTVVGWATPGDGS